MDDVRTIRPVPAAVWAAWLRRKAATEQPVVLTPKAAHELADLIDPPTS